MGISQEMDQSAKMQVSPEKKQAQYKMGYVQEMRHYEKPADDLFQDHSIDNPFAQCHILTRQTVDLGDNLVLQ